LAGIFRGKEEGKSKTKTSRFILGEVRKGGNYLGFSVRDDYKNATKKIDRKAKRGATKAGNKDVVQKVA